MVSENFTFKFERDEYERYESWCKENDLDGYYGAIGGSTSFEITPTSIGDIVTVFADVVVKDELGEISYDTNGEPKRRRIELKLREL